MQQAEHDIREYEVLWQGDNALLGRIIKCHLISEIYLDRHLSHKLSLTNLTDARLSYYQKVMLLPESDAMTAFLRPGLLTLNKLRNKIAHDLRSTLSKGELSTMTDVLIMSKRSASTMSAIEMVEKFTALSCAGLNPSPPKIAELFATAMKHTKLENGSR